MPELIIKEGCNLRAGEDLEELKVTTTIRLETPVSNGRPFFVLLCFNILNFLGYLMVIWQTSIMKNEKISRLYID